ncbi:MAG: GntR family transcriptional regulator [Treponema sp.]|jgi:GntR family transcriptional repressor for pyruvate dehydrogenase complex|nr:GntR family transcriptional regulator [Treponema sp.]
MAFDKIAKNERIAEQVYQALRRAIFERHFQVGDKLPSEGLLSKQFGVSKPSVKCALQRLAALGFIETRVGQGSFVLESDPNLVLVKLRDLPLSDNDIAQITEYRMYFEMNATRLALKKITEDNFHKLEAILRQMDEAVERDDSTLHSTLDYEFHLEVCRATQNRAFVFSYETVGKILRKHANALNEAFFRKVRSSGQQSGEDVHWKLVNAMRSKDINECRMCYLQMFSVLEPLSLEEFKDC